MNPQHPTEPQERKIRRNKAKRHAMSRLADAHLSEYTQLYVEELRKEGL